MPYLGKERGVQRAEDEAVDEQSQVPPVLVQVEAIVNADPVRVRLRDSGRPSHLRTRSVTLLVSLATNHGIALANPQGAENIDVLDGRVSQAPVDHLRQLAAWRRVPAPNDGETMSARTAHFSKSARLQQHTMNGARVRDDARKLHQRGTVRVVVVVGGRLGRLPRPRCATKRRIE